MGTILVIGADTPIGLAECKLHAANGKKVVALVHRRNRRSTEEQLGDLIVSGCNEDSSVRVVTIDDRVSRDSVETLAALWKMHCYTFTKIVYALKRTPAEVFECMRELLCEGGAFVIITDDEESLSAA